MTEQRTLATWIMATRPQFFTVIVLPILLGTVIAWSRQSVFLPEYFVLALLGGILAHAGINVLNDYFDHLNRSDELNREPLTPFAGGSRMIQRRLIAPREMFYYGLMLLGGVIFIGLFLVWSRGLPVFFLGLLGVLSGYFYSSPPLALNSRGWGEFLVGLNFGVLAVLGGYYVQVQRLDPVAVGASLPLAFLVAAILYINQFPDYEADREAGKRTLVVKLGRWRARPVFAALLAGGFFSLLVGVWLELIPLLALLALLALPLALRAIQVVYLAHDLKAALVPGIKNTILLHATISLLLMLAFALSAVR